MSLIAVHILILVGAVVLTIVLCGWYFTARTRSKLDFMLDALEDGEANFHFNRGGFIGRRINPSLNRLKGLFDREVQQIRERERYYGQLLDKVQTGVIVAEPGSECIIYINRIAREILGVATLSSMRQICAVDSGIYEAFSSERDGVATFTDERDRRRISVSISADSIDGREVKIIAFNDISSSIETTETESWTKLIRVLTHEIMNTVTPIASLSEALKEVEGEDLRSGLETIGNSSRSLIRFVESYRSLTRVAAPVRKAFDVGKLAQELCRPVFDGAGAEATFEVRSEDIFLYADRGQISQILVNLVKNAVQAGAAHVRIAAEIDKRDRVIISVSNDGPAISPASQEQIFVPFYTTKPDGTGIGLSLSRQIMRLHGGNLRLVRSDAEETVFALEFN